MKHRVFGRKLNRDHNARKSLFKNLISSIIKEGQITTTEAKAKAIRGLMDKMVTKAKQQTVQSRRLLVSFLQDKDIVNKLVDEIAPKFSQRAGGYTRILRLGKRTGDNAEMVKIEFVETVVSGFNPPVKVKITKKAGAKELPVKKVKTQADKKHTALIKPTKKTAIKKQVKEKKAK